MVEKGSIIRVDYEAWTSEGELFDTTKKDVAKANHAFQEETVYEPLPIVVGVGRVIPGFDAALLAAKAGEEADVTVPPAEAFGERDASKVETFALREFQKRDMEPRPGQRIQHENRVGTVVSVSAGRVRIDFNPPLAGKTLRYKFTVKSEVVDPVEKVRTLIELNYGQGRADGFGVEVEGSEVTIKLPDSCKYDSRWFVAKYRLVSDLRAYAGAKTMRFVEEYTTDEPPAAASEAATPPA